MRSIAILFLVSLIRITAFSACELYDLQVDRSDCNKEKKFTLTIDFKHKETSDCFTIKGGGKNYGTFLYSQLPVQLVLSGDCTTDYEFVIRDCHSDNCKLTYLLGKVCCETECSLSDLHLERTDCNEEQNFCVSLSFKHEGTSKCFKVSGNGKYYGTFSYSQLPVKICGLKGDCETEYEFVITDCEKEECSVTGSLGIVCCEKPCKLYDLKVEKTECNADQQFFVFLNFKYKDTSECFKIFQNGTLYGTYKYYQLPVKLGPFAGDCHTNYEFLVKDCHNDTCKVGYNLGKVCCEQECHLSDLHMERTECDADQNFCVYLGFKYQGTSNCFKVTGNGHEYGSFSYSQVPVKICGLKGDCDTDYEFVVADCEKQECSVSGNLGIVCCEETCNLSDLKLEETECNNDAKFYVFLNFKYNHTSDCFKVIVNGNVNGTYNYSQLPLKIGPFDGDCKTHYEFKIVDCQDEHCTVAAELGIVCCEKKTCSINGLQITKSDCNSDNNFFVKINFRHFNTSSCFKVRGNGIFYGTFNYNQLPITIGPLKGDCKTFYEFIVYDCENEHCRASKGLGRVCCEQHKKGDIGNPDEGLFHLDNSSDERSAAASNVIYTPGDQTLTVFPGNSSAGTVKIQIYNMMGSPVHFDEQGEDFGNISIAVGQWQPGMYFVKLKRLDKEEVFRFIKI